MEKLSVIIVTEIQENLGSLLELDKKKSDEIAELKDQLQTISRILGSAFDDGDEPFNMATPAKDLACALLNRLSDTKKELQDRVKSRNTANGLVEEFSKLNRALEEAGIPTEFIRVLGNNPEHTSYADRIRWLAANRDAYAQKLKESEERHESRTCFIKALQALLEKLEVKP
jgi:hypothetical protein